MDLGEFLAQLAGGGRVRVARSAAGPRTSGADRILRDLDQAVRLDAPDDLPHLDLVAARWAAGMLYQACALFAYRDLDADEVTGRLGAACPSVPELPASHYSVDLALRHLPDLFDLTRGIAPDDPLLVGLRSLARQWPLSSVGIADIHDTDPKPLLASPCLLGLYLDRIVDRGDLGRAQHPRVRHALDAVLGEQYWLAPQFAAVARDPT